MLSVKNAFCGYDGFDVIHGVSFEVSAGQNLCIAGPNGCGKTTILRAIAGLLPYKGHIEFENSEISSLKRAKIAKSIALMTQITSVYFSYSIYETVMLGRYLHINGGAFASPSKEDKQYVMQCLEDVGLADLKDRQITSLSGGQLQRVFLARTFAQEPSMILLDEPTNHLDLKYQIELIERLREWSAQKNRAIIGVLHDLNLTMHFADKVLLLNDGKTAAFGDVQDVLEGGLLRQVYGVDVKGYMMGSLRKWE
jgi:iron complex transport system ATP-binding protein